MTAYYNEIDPYAAQWLRNLIAAGHIALGDVDERSIADVRPDDLTGYRQCHFFAGIGVWSYALRRAGWPDDLPVWTGSCPCQPFSPAGRGEGFADERHLWPAWHHLISQCGPPVVFGEQTSSKAVGPWIDLVSADLEGVGYTLAAGVFPSASIGAPIERHRTYFVAKAVAGSRGWGWEWIARPKKRDDDGSKTGRHESVGQSLDGCSADDRDPWKSCDWIPGGDGHLRPVEPGTFPLAYGAPARMGRLRAYGNAINAEAATAFIGAYLGCERLRLTGEFTMATNIGVFA